MDLKQSQFGWYGIVIGLVALSVSAMSPWIMRLNSPPPKPIDEVVVETAKRIKQEMAFGSEEQSLSPTVYEQATWAETIVSVSMVMALSAIGLGLLSWRAKENKMASGGAVAIGGTALAVQFLWVILLIVLGAFIVAAAYQLIELGGV